VSPVKYELGFYIPKDDILFLERVLTCFSDSYRTIMYFVMKQNFK
jgi:hypothetical protein